VGNAKWVKLQGIKEIISVIFRRLFSSH